MATKFSKSFDSRISKENLVSGNFLRDDGRLIEFHYGLMVERSLKYFSNETCYGKHAIANGPGSEF